MKTANSWTANRRLQQWLPLWAMLACMTLIGGCSQRPRAWGFPGGQGTVERQTARASVHDPYPLNDIGPEVVGARPREFMMPRSEASREASVPRQYRNLPPGY